MSSTTSCGWRPLPRAMRMMREGSVQILGLGLSSSFVVMLSIMHMKRLMRAPPSFSFPWRRGAGFRVPRQPLRSPARHTGSSAYP